MITQIAVRIRKLKKWFSRSYWAISLLHLSKSEGTSASPGLVLIQIDGLSLAQYRRGVREGNLPFLSSLIRKQKYKEYPHYSGLPSATPAVQGELFYGVKGCVPAFNFIDNVSGQTFVMYDPKSASQIENRLGKENAPLLAEGSSYSNIFTGGAKESHFCAASLGWNGLFKALNPLALTVIFIFYLNIYIRTFFLFIVELVIGFYESIRGILKGEKFLFELQFILTRVFICVLLREMVILGAKVDIARGLPVIHLNFFGYDEQSHRRGPSSKFAHWSLRGIDDGISRICKESRSADRRDYDVWVYSDHGQEDTIPYGAEHEKTVQEVILNIFGGPEKVTVTGMGPMGHIYPKTELSVAEKERVISELLTTAKIPLVLIPTDTGQVEARRLNGKFMLPEDAGMVLGEDHPFLQEATRDLVTLCHHPSAGKIIFSGWCKGMRPRTFPLENGSHGGFSPEETSAFALLPPDAPLPPLEHSYLRPLDIRQAALTFLGKTVESESSTRAAPAFGGTLRLMTYNVHACIGMDGKISPERIARVIARHQPDIVALQELDVTRLRTGGVDQAEVIAQKLCMTFHFHPTLSIKKEKYGNAIFSKWPIRPIRTGPLPKLLRGTLLEPRGALWVEIDVEGKKTQILNTHLSLSQREGLMQMEVLLGPDWIGNPACRGPVILCGDFNASLQSRLCNRVGRVLKNAQLELDDHRALNTWASFSPLRLIDHVFVGPGIKIKKIEVPRTELERASSDHLPLIVEFQIES